MPIILVNVLGVWVLCLLVAVLMNKGRGFAYATWRVLANPFVIIWRHYGSHILTLLVGIALGAYYAQDLTRFFAN